MSDLPERFVDVTFILGSGTFAESGTNKVKLTNHRVSCTIQKAGGAAKAMSQTNIWGMSLSLMNKLSTLGLVLFETTTPDQATQVMSRNTIIIEARTGPDGHPAQVYMGTITAAATDFQNAPDVPFRVESQGGSFEAVVNASAISHKGSVGVSQFMAQIVAAMNVNLPSDVAPIKLENSLSQEVYLTDQNFNGSPWDQMRAAALAAGVSATIDDGVLVLTDKAGGRTGDAVILSPSTGLVGYPTYISQGLKVRTLYNPGIRFRGTVQIQDSIVKQANGTWLVLGIDHRLDSLVPGGDWFSDLFLYSPRATVILQ